MHFQGLKLILKAVFVAESILSLSLELKESNGRYIGQIVNQLRICSDVYHLYDGVQVANNGSQPSLSIQNTSCGNAQVSCFSSEF